MSIRVPDATRDRPTSRRDDSSARVPLELRSGVWWLHPGWAGILAVLPGLAVTCLVPADDFQLWWRTPKYFQGTHALLTVLLLGAFVAGTLLPNLTRRRSRSRGPRPGATAVQLRTLLWSGRVFLVLTLTGYVAWTISAVSRGYGMQQLSNAIELKQGALMSARYESLSTVPGITTLTQFGPLAIACLLLHRRLSGQRHTVALAGLVLLTVARGFINVERLAMMEMAIPLIVLTAAVAPRSRQKHRKLLWAMSPAIAPVALAVFFGAFEYTRSWNDFYAQHGNTGFMGFVLRRLGGYYATAANNAVLLLSHSRSSSLPYYTLPFIWNFPIIGSVFQPHSGVISGPSSWMSMLAEYGNDEFNNAGGLLPVIADYGLAGALAWWGAVGFLLGICYHSMRSGDLRGLLIYAVTYVGILEMGQLFYWGLGRAFPVMAGGIVLTILFRRTESGDSRPRDIRR